MIRAVTVCVDYGDLLKRTLPQMLRVFDHVTVVTHYSDVETQAIVRILRGEGERVHAHLTDAFYHDECEFNKGRAIEEAFSRMKRVGWFAVVDADVAVPDYVKPNLTGLDETCLYSARRRRAEVDDFDAKWGDWADCPLMNDTEHGGWLQVFHANAAGDAPWYPTVWKHAGGCDSGFMLKWPRGKRRWLPCDVIHYGDDGVNWHGRVTQRADGAAPCDPKEMARRYQLTDNRRHQRDVLGKQAFANERLDGIARVR